MHNHVPQGPGHVFLFGRDGMGIIGSGVLWLESHIGVRAALDQRQHGVYHFICQAAQVTYAERG